MNNRISIIIMITAIIAIGMYAKFKKIKYLKGLGKINPNRPPKIRILYSKKQLPKNRKKINSSSQAYDVFKQVWSSQIETREEMVILLLDQGNNVIGFHTLSMGGITGTVADLRILFAVALKSLATGFIMAHNHPSGNINPSQADLNLTKKIKEAGKVMDINLIDHLIITKETYYSFADEGTI